MRDGIHFVLTSTFVVLGVTWATTALAGDLEPAAPPAPTMKTLAL